MKDLRLHIILYLTFVRMSPPKHEAIKINALECVFSYAANQKIQPNCTNHTLSRWL